VALKLDRQDDSKTMKTESIDGACNSVPPSDVRNMRLPPIFR